MSGTGGRVIDEAEVRGRRGQESAAQRFGAAWVVLLALSLLIAILLVLAGRSAMDAVAARIREDLAARVDDLLSSIDQQQSAALADLDRWARLSPWASGEPNSGGSGPSSSRARLLEPARLERFEDLSGTRHVLYRREGERLIAEDHRQALADASRAGSTEPGEAARMALFEGRHPVERIDAAGGHRLARYQPLLDRDARVTGAWRISIGLAPYEQRVRDGADRLRLAEGVSVELREAAAGPGRFPSASWTGRNAASGGIVIVGHHPAWDWQVSAEADPSAGFAPVRRGLLLAGVLSAGTALLLAIGLVGWRRHASAGARFGRARETSTRVAHEKPREPAILIAPMPSAWARELQS